MLALSSPAKVNLFLKVLNRRRDGFYNLASLFQTIDLCDTIHLRLQEKDELSSTDERLPTDASNLVLKAANIFRRNSGKQFGVRAHLEKIIPSEAGLGGGSSNAATTLWALNQMHGNLVPNPTLIQWAAQVGSDVPFFLSEGTAYVTGRGEIIKPLQPLLQRFFWLVKPHTGLSTKKVFEAMNLGELSTRNPNVALQRWIFGKPQFFNDLEVPAFKVLPQLGLLKKELLFSGFDHVSLTGSGTAFICMGGNTAEPPFVTGLALYPAKFLNRVEGKWY